MAAGVYTGGGATVVMDPPPIVYVTVFGKGSGPDRHAKNLANRVAILARQIAPVGATGRLSSSVRAGQNRDEKGRFAFGYEVYATAPYSYYVHEGTGPSLRITENDMVFKGTNQFAGRKIKTKIVFHPGTPANPFLSEALSAMGG